MKNAKMHKLVLLLDNDDLRSINAEIDRWRGHEHMLPEGRSNYAGAIIAEALRSLDEYRALHGIPTSQKYVNTEAQP